jgi:hypothetical protein
MMFGPSAGVASLSKMIGSTFQDRGIDEADITSGEKNNQSPGS